MTECAHAPALAFLSRAGLFTAVLALVAGILGMHVITANHANHTSGMSAAAAVTTAGNGSSPAAKHAPGGSAAHDMHGDHDGTGSASVQCTGPGNCADATTAACTPSAKVGTLTAPLPGNGFLAGNTSPGTPLATGALWSYLPDSPSPVELCISRT